jgi:transcription elongation factor Elf1
MSWLNPHQNPKSRDPKRLRKKLKSPHRPNRRARKRPMVKCPYCEHRQEMDLDSKVLDENKNRIMICENCGQPLILIEKPEE